MKFSRQITLLVLTVTLIFTVGCAKQPSSLNGVATYRERMALPPEAVLEITLEDVSLMDVKAPVIAQKSEQVKGQVPLSFSLKYDPKLIKERHRYNLRAKILVNGKLVFITDTSNPVLDNKADKEIKLVMKKVQ